MNEHIPNEDTPNGVPATNPDAEVVRDDQVVMPAAQLEDASQNGPDDVEVEDRIRAMSRRSFLWGALAVGAGYGGIRWIGSRRLDDNVPWPLRRGLQVNEGFARDLFDEGKLAPEFPRARARQIRVNGDIGLEEDFDAATWKLMVEGLAGADSSKSFSLAQIKALPRVTMTTEHKCIEGWATVVTWSGARLRDFITKYPPSTTSGDALDLKKHPEDLPDYISLETPGGGYYVGLEREAALHPQTLLCYELNGKPLTLEHGAPLRLVIPVKYGTKSLKRIGTLRYVAERPADYWAEQGYDYHGGH